MPRVTHVKKARKDNPVCKAGESYYWWKFRYGGKRYSLTRPRASQLTQSPYYGMIYGLQETIEDWDGEQDDIDGLKEEVRDELDCLKEECQGNLDNIPEQLQDAPTGELLNERIDACETALDALDSVETSFTSDLDESESSAEERAEELENWVQEVKDEMSSALDDCIV